MPSFQLREVSKPMCLDICPHFTLALRSWRRNKLLKPFLCQNNLSVMNSSLANFISRLCIFEVNESISQMLLVFAKQWNMRLYFYTEGKSNSVPSFREIFAVFDAILNTAEAIKCVRLEMYTNTVQVARSSRRNIHCWLQTHLYHNGGIFIDQHH